MGSPLQSQSGSHEVLFRRKQVRVGRDLVSIAIICLHCFSGLDVFVARFHLFYYSNGSSDKKDKKNAKDTMLVIDTRGKQVDDLSDMLVSLSTSL